MANDGITPVAYTLTVNGYTGTAQTVTVGANSPVSVSWPVDADGYYDVIIIVPPRKAIVVANAD